MIEAISLKEEIINQNRSIYERAVFKDWEKFLEDAEELEKKIKSCFKLEKPVLKLIGSSTTRTLRQGTEDYDYAVAFQRPISNQQFLERLAQSDLDITDIVENNRYGYIKACGRYKRKDFVLVPMLHPNGKIAGYEQDAFYHTEFINLRRRPEHELNVILAKEFFSQIGVYKEVKGISCELMILYFRDFARMISHFSSQDSLRVNFSPNPANYADNPLIVDYPYLGGRSLTDRVDRKIYDHIQKFSRAILSDYKLFKGRG